MKNIGMIEFSGNMYSALKFGKLNILISYKNQIG
jgi:hypothetical protein